MPTVASTAVRLRNQNPGGLWHDLGVQSFINDIVVLVQRVWRKKYYGMGGKAGDPGPNHGILTTLWVWDKPPPPGGANVTPDRHGPRDWRNGLAEYYAPWPKHRSWY